MTRRVWLLGPSLLLAAAGCLPEENGLSIVSAGFFDDAPSAAAPAGQVVHAAASEATGKRVVQVGAQILTSNPTLSVHPVFTTIGVPWEEIFHRDDKAVFITEGLASECRTDGQLAAVLAHELGKMDAERQQLAGPPPDHGPPMDAPAGGDYAGALGSPDRTRAMELAVYERKRRKAVQDAATPPDAEALARAILEKAGGNAADLESVAELLRAAEAHVTLEKQMGQ